MPYLLPHWVMSRYTVSPSKIGLLAIPISYSHGPYFWVLASFLPWLPQKNNGINPLLLLAAECFTVLCNFLLYCPHLCQQCFFKLLSVTIVISSPVSYKNLEQRSQCSTLQTIGRSAGSLKQNRNIKAHMIESSRRPRAPAGQWEQY